jgi:hypothetical protein
MIKVPGAADQTVGEGKGLGGLGNDFKDGAARMNT